MSVLNQMLRDLEARGVSLEPVAVAPATASSAASVPPATALAMAAQDAKARDRRRRFFLWGVTISAVALGAALWAWGEHQVRQARIVRAPLGATQFKSAVVASAMPAAATAAAATPPTPVAQIATAATAAVTPPQSPATSVTPTIVDTPAAASVAPTVAPTVASKPAPRAAQTALARSPASLKPRDTAAVETPKPITAAAASDAPVVQRSAQSLADPEADAARAADLIARGRATEAAALLQKILSARPQHLAARRALAALQAEAGAREQALATLLEGASLDAANFAVPAASLQAELGDLAGARATLARVPQQIRSPAQLALAAALAQRMGQHDAAIESFRAALARHNDAAWWLGLAASLEAVSRRSDALAAYNAALAVPTLSADLRQYAAQKAAALNVAPRAGHEALATAAQPY
jgi:Flp pilus assembly protein TadD